MRFVRKNSIFNFIYEFAIIYPSPANLNLFYNFGFLALLALVSQILTGIFLAMHYVPHVDYAFASVEHIMRDVNYVFFYVICMLMCFFFFYSSLCTYSKRLYFGAYAFPRQLV